MFQLFKCFNVRLEYKTRQSHSFRVTKAISHYETELFTAVKTSKVKASIILSCQSAESQF